MPRRTPPKAKLIRAIRVTAKTMDTIGKTTYPLSKDIRRFLTQHAAWLRLQLKP